MKRLVTIVISLVIGSVTLPLLAIAGMTGGSSGSGLDSTCRDRAVSPRPTRPSAVTGGWDAEQLANAGLIVEVGHAKQVPPWGWVIAVATAIQESRLRNLPHLGEQNDHDSIGLFQQRPSQGWGTIEQLSDPAYQAAKFFDALLDVKDWHELPLTEAAQAVQNSAYPDAYAQHTTDAVRLVSQVGVSVGLFTAAVTECVSISPMGWTQPVAGPVVSGYGIRAGRMHAGIDIAAPRHTIIRASASGTVTRVRCNAVDRYTGEHWGCHRDGDPDRTAGCGWYLDLSHTGGITTRYCHLQTQPWVRPGDPVIVGQPIGTVGSTGHSSGPHLHFEVRVDGHATDPLPWMAIHGAPLGARGRCLAEPHRGGQRRRRSSRLPAEVLATMDVAISTNSDCADNAARR